MAQILSVCLPFILIATTASRRAVSFASARKAGARGVIAQPKYDDIAVKVWDRIAAVSWRETFSTTVRMVYPSVRENRRCVEAGGDGAQSIDAGGH